MQSKATDPGLGHLASRRREHGHLPGAGPVHQHVQPGVGVAGLRAHLHQLQRGQPGGAFQVTATITWDVTWQGAGGADGALAPLFTTAAAAFRVAESQALNTSGT